MKIKTHNKDIVTEEYVENGIVLRTKQGDITCNIINVHRLHGKLNPIHTKVFHVEGGEDFCLDICTDPRLKEVLKIFEKFPNMPMLEFRRGDLHIEITL